MSNTSPSTFTLSARELATRIDESRGAVESHETSRWTAESFTHVGHKRERQEDRLLVVDADQVWCGLFAVVDGMGGAPGGDVAAQITVDALREAGAVYATWAREYGASEAASALANRSKALAAGIASANTKVRAEAERRGYHGMGAVVAAVLLGPAPASAATSCPTCALQRGEPDPLGGYCADRWHDASALVATVAHVGDARVYLQRKAGGCVGDYASVERRVAERVNRPARPIESGRVSYLETVRGPKTEQEWEQARGRINRTSASLHQLTTDDNMRSSYLRMGWTEERIAEAYSPEALTKGVGVDATVEPTVTAFTVFPRDVLLLSTDGLHGALSAPAIATALLYPGAGAELLRKVLDGPALDNVTGIVVRVRGDG
jgi:serine/threonine protein phosphatase PrpC